MAYGFANFKITRKSKIRAQIKKYESWLDEYIKTLEQSGENNELRTLMFSKSGVEAKLTNARKEFDDFLKSKEYQNFHEEDKSVNWDAYRNICVKFQKIANEVDSLYSDYKKDHFLDQFDKGVDEYDALSDKLDAEKFKKDLESSSKLASYNK